MIARRAVVAAPLALAAGRARGDGGVPPGDRLGFKVMRKGSEIGTHLLAFRRNGDLLQAEFEVRLAIGIGPITLFRYRHSGVETWRGDRFDAIETSTDNDGEALHMAARRTDAGIVVDSSKVGRHTLGAAALPLTHWNVACMSAPLFNAQDGKPMRLVVTPHGADRVALASGASLPARCYALAGEAMLEDWYDSNDVWTALRAVATDGSVLEYRRIG